MVRALDLSLSVEPRETRNLSVSQTKLSPSGAVNDDSLSVDPVNTAEIENALSVDVHPHVVVTGDAELWRVRGLEDKVHMEEIGEVEVVLVHSAGTCASGRIEETLFGVDLPQALVTSGFVRDSRRVAPAVVAEATVVNGEVGSSPLVPNVHLTPVDSRADGGRCGVLGVQTKLGVRVQQSVVAGHVDVPLVKVRFAGEHAHSIVLDRGVPQGNSQDRVKVIFGHSKLVLRNAAIRRPALEIRNQFGYTSSIQSAIRRTGGCVTTVSASGRRKGPNVRGNERGVDVTLAAPKISYSYQ